MNVRKATQNDLEGIANVHVSSWKTTYKGIISDSYLNSLSVEGRKKSWEWTFNNLNKDETIFLAEDNGRIVGFSNGGKSRSNEFEHDGELYAIYLLKDYQRQGIGRMLVDSVVESLKSKNYKSLLVWVLEGNPSLNFYKRIGGGIIAKKEITIGGDTLNEVAIGWSSLNSVKV
jgi:ribosomal protein S18 acetylase RimI-like enzyme